MNINDGMLWLPKNLLSSVVCDIFPARPVAAFLFAPRHAETKITVLLSFR